MSFEVTSAVPETKDFAVFDFYYNAVTIGTIKTKLADPVVITFTLSDSGLGKSVTLTTTIMPEPLKIAEMLPLFTAAIEAEYTPTSLVSSALSIQLPSIVMELGLAGGVYSDFTFTVSSVLPKT